MESSDRRSGRPVRDPASQTAASAGTVAKQPSNVIVQLHQRILPRHQALLARWIDAGRVDGTVRRLGVHADRVPPSAAEPGLTDYVLVWVRENIDPAYMVVPDRTGWLIVDAVRQQQLARVAHVRRGIEPDPAGSACRGVRLDRSTRFGERVALTEASDMVRTHRPRAKSSAALTAKTAAGGTTRCLRHTSADSQPTRRQGVVPNS